MKRITACFASLMVLGCLLAAQAQGATHVVNLVGVGLANPPSPPSVVTNDFVSSQAVVTGDDTADACIQRHLAELAQPVPQLPVACRVVSYVSFWIDLPSRQVRSPEPSGGCPVGPTTCQFMGQDDQAPYSLVERYLGPAGRHTATAQAWRYVWGDAQPVLLGTVSKRFCLYRCNGG